MIDQGLASRSRGPLLINATRINDLCRMQTAFDYCTLGPAGPPCFCNQEAQCRHNQPAPHLLPPFELGIALLPDPFRAVGPRQALAQRNTSLCELIEFQRGRVTLD